MNAVIALLVALVVGGAYYEGHRSGDAKCAQERADAMASYKRLEDRFNVASNDLQRILLEQDKHAADINTRVAQIVERPVYRSVCLDGDGLRLVNEALLGVTAPAAANGHEVLRRVDAP